jgi:hypothetical protein
MNEDTQIDWSSDSTAPAEEQLTVIGQIASEMLMLESEIQAQEELIKSLKKQHMAICQGTLPEALMAVGLTGITHVSGKKLTVEKFYQAKIPDTHRAEAFQWLEDTGNDSIIKTDVSAKFGKGDKAKAEEAVKLLEEHGIIAGMKTGVHHSTLRAFVKEQLENGEPLPLEAFGVYVGNRVKVK